MSQFNDRRFDKALGNSIRESQDFRATAEAESMAQRSINPNYMARIVYQPNSADDPEDPGVIALYLPENFQLNFASSFDQPFSQGMVNMPGLSGAAKFFGASLTSQSMSVQVWQGTQCPEFNLTFVLVADSDPVQDILLPIKRLSKLALPGVMAGLLTPPGPRISLTALKDAVVAVGSSVVSGVAGALTTDFAASVGSLQSIGTGISSALGDILKNPENNTSLYIGRFLFFPSVVIQSVSQTYDTVFDKNGRPLKANVDITFSTWYVPVKTDVDTIFVK